MRTKLVAGNWKMNGSMAANDALLRSVLAGVGNWSGTNCVVCPPFPYLSQAWATLKGSRIALGAQNVSEHQNGAFTGEVAATMLKEMGCRYVIVGHSERRSLYLEDDEVVSKKFQAAQQADLVPILCVGETLAQREAGETETVVARQLDAVLGLCGVTALKNAVVAYEPVWAIGSGKNATPEQAQAVHRFIRNRIAARDAQVANGLPILYGGSVKASNAAQLFAQSDVDGGLIGGASLVAQDFTAICQAASPA
jgi:triosephosphate isomerase (TIM)